MSRLEQLEALLASDPDDVFLNFGLAMEMGKAGRHEACLAQFARVIELDPNYVTAYFQKAKALLQTGDREGAKEALRTGMAQAESSGDHHSKSEMEQMLNTL